MNAVKSNLQSLRDEIVEFKQEFGQLKSETSSSPHKLTLQCLQCLPRSVQSSVELSEDPYETFERFKTHLTDSNHDKHVHNMKTFRIHCTSCNGDLILQNNFSACQSSIMGHLKSTKHETVYRAVVSNAFSSLSSRFMTLQCQVKELDGKLDAIIGKIEMIETGGNEPSKYSAVEEFASASSSAAQLSVKTESVLPATANSNPQPVATKPKTVTKEPKVFLIPSLFVHHEAEATTSPTVTSKPQHVDTKPKVLPQTVTAEPQVVHCLSGWVQPMTEATLPLPVASKPLIASPNNYQPAVKYPSNATIICNACKCAVSCSRQPVGILGNVEAHLQGSNHQTNIKKTADHSFRCLICQFSVLISTDSSSSIEIVQTHVYGSRHSPDEDFDDNLKIICNACEYSITSDYWSWNIEEDDMDNINEHLDSPLHESNMSVAVNRTIWCGKCNCDVAISEDRNSAIWSMRKHFNEKHPDYYEEQQTDVESEDEVYDESSVIICNVCQILVACSNDPEWKDNGLMLRSLMHHLENDMQHRQYLMKRNKKRSLWCSKCNYPIPISFDLQSSRKNILKHLNTLRHSLWD